MKVLKRILIKTLILLLVIAGFGGGAAGWQAKRQSTAEYAVKHYLALLIDNNAEKAFVSLDQSESDPMTLEEYSAALDAAKYSLYASCEIEEIEKRRDKNGNEYADYKVTFKNAADEAQKEAVFTAKKQSEAVLGIFDRWKVLSDHCLVKDFELKVPSGAVVYLNAELADSDWIEKTGQTASVDTYRIPTLAPGKVRLTIRHSVLESVNTSMDAAAGSADFTEQLQLKDSAKSECMEIGVKLLQTVYASAAKEKTEDPDALLNECRKEADALIRKQSSAFHTEEGIFKNAAISGFAPKFGDVVLTEENGALRTEMTFHYHYVVRRDAASDTGEQQEDGTPIQTTETVEQSGDASAVMTLDYYGDQWHVSAVEMQVIPE